MSADNPIFDKIEEIRKNYSLFDERDAVLVALSGGADSVSLLLALRKRYPGLLITACHVNHKLRGKSADADAAFAKNLCKREHIPFELLEIDVAAVAEERKVSTELAARQVRYEFFEEVCRKRKISIVATAHTASDNAETVLFNLTRGTGLAGLCGIPPKRALNDAVQIVRPLLFVTREEVEAFLKERDQCYVTDASNFTDDYSRNYLRHHVIPALKKINPSFEKNLKKPCAALRETQIFIDKTANNTLTDSLVALAGLDECILRSVIVRLYEKSGGCMQLENVHIEKIAMLVRSCAQDLSKNAEVCLPGKLSAKLLDGKLYFEPTVRGKKENYAVPFTEPIPLKIGLTDIAGTPFAVQLLPADELLLPQGKKELEALLENFMLYDSVFLDREALSGPLFVRLRTPGDTVRMSGMTKKLKELLNKKKVSKEIRSLLPIVCDKNGILFVPRVALCDAHKKAVSNASHILRLAIYSKSPL